jgi:hypothetical protein
VAEADAVATADTDADREEVADRVPEAVDVTVVDKVLYAEE